MKRQHSDALLLFRMGDFYETFDDDAETVAGVLGIALTSRPMGKDGGRVPLAGIPYHALDRYLDRLLTSGHRVAICEQTSPPGKGLVERRVVRVVTPGTADSGALVEERAHNWLLAVGPPSADGRVGLAACDVTTGELECRVLALAEVAAEWVRLAPGEVLVPRGVTSIARPPSSASSAASVVERPVEAFAPARGARLLEERFEVASASALGLDGAEVAAGAAGALLAYLRETWPEALSHVRPPRVVHPADEVVMDPQTRRSLELTEGGRGDVSLLSVLDQTLTPPGARLLRDWLSRPLRRRDRLEARLDRVEALAAHHASREALRRALRGLPDFERLLGRARAGTATARQLVTLRAGLERLPAVAEAARAGGAPALEPLADTLSAARDVAEIIAAAIADEPPADLGDGGTARPGFNAAIDDLRELAGDARAALSALERDERERTGLPVRVGYHRVFGYYLELGRAQAARVPEDYEPRQTLANVQRFRCAALVSLETRILEAREQLETAERELFEQVRAQVAMAGAGVERAAAAVARLDVAAALASVAADSGWVRPDLAEGGPLVIEAGRHPVVEQQLPRGAFVPNDLVLGDRTSNGADVIVLTGPNMGGKSTYLRQAALIAILAQCGSFVPAASARVPLVDRICARIGAQDDIASGQSTFMVEMVETASILRTATERSLVILDEVGRGTATQDGLAIARAVVEYLHHRPGGSPLTLFATHYQELTALASELPRVENRSVAVSEREGEVVFLHRIVPGGADRSYGVHVAELAGLPRAVVERAAQLLREAEKERGRVEVGGQLPLLGSLLGTPTEPDPLLAELAALEPDGLTPLEALQQLYTLRRAARERLAVEG